MSASMVRKSLAIVDADFDSPKGEKRKAKKQNIGHLIPENQKLVKTVNRKGQKEKVALLRSETKTTVAEARKTHKSKQQILKANLEKLKLLQQACTVDLNEETTEQLIERAVTKRPIKLKKASEKEQETVFSLEDFAKFEKEYLAT